MARNKVLEKLSWIPMKVWTNHFQGKEEVVEVDLNKLGLDIKFPFYIGKERAMGSLSSELRCFGVREPNNLRHYPKFITDKDTLLDVGANFGFFSVLGKNAKEIIAIEPVKECNTILKKNLVLNDIMDKTKIFNIALGNGESVLMHKAESSNLSRVVKDVGEGDYKVDCKPLKYFADEFKVSCVKMDVEGYEWEIFSEQRIPETINKIVLEFHRTAMGIERSVKLVELFYEQGFTVRFLLEDMPLRFYPFIGYKWILNALTHTKENLSQEECIRELKKGRGIKYLYLIRK